jgi:hypothetical protein
MKRRFTEEQIIGILREQEAGRPKSPAVPGLLRGMRQGAWPGETRYRRERGLSAPFSVSAVLVVTQRRLTVGESPDDAAWFWRISATFVGVTATR